MELFEILDQDGSGAVDRLEFIDRLSNVVISQQTIESMQNQKILHLLSHNAHTVEQCLTRLAAQVIARVDGIADVVSPRGAAPPPASEPGGPRPEGPSSSR